MNKKTMSERDICTKFITPALVKSSWDLQRQIREELSLGVKIEVIEKIIVDKEWFENI